MTLTEKFQNSLCREKSILPGEKILIACSGGPDSTALFYLLNNLSSSWKLKLRILHFNHSLRGRESDADAAFVKKMARHFKIPCSMAKGRVQEKARKERLSLEEAARFERYDFFIRAAKKHKVKKVVLAHTLDDQAETVLMRLFQGTGLRGLCGIRKKNVMKGVSFLRPLLEFEKAEILSFLKERKVRFREDKSNRQTSFLRNRIRLKFLPWLKKDVNPRIVQALARIPAIACEEVELLSEMEEDAWKRVFKSRQKRAVEMDRSAFLSCSAPLQFRILDRALKCLDLKSGVNFDAWQRIRGHLSQKNYRCSLPKSIDFILTPSKLRLYRE
jgi:tRNA(Ile)-lysidine synthase